MAWEEKSLAKKGARAVVRKKIQARRVSAATESRRAG